MVDPSNINAWLGSIGTDFKQYTYNLVQAGVDRDFLKSITTEHLSRDCQILNGVHRTKILDAVQKDATHPNRHDEPVAESKLAHPKFHISLWRHRYVCISLRNDVIILINSHKYRSINLEPAKNGKPAPKKGK